MATDDELALLRDDVRASFRHIAARLYRIEELLSPDKPEPLEPVDALEPEPKWFLDTDEGAK